ncbi:MAG: multicopper oxidase domain-containing protein [Acidobacteria bacterium]|nr:multicopper oxidase domain-containing protein [Acidobacteriota bacterium]
MMSVLRNARFSLLFLLALFPLALQSKTVEYKLTIAKEEVNITGKPVMGMTVNGSIPGPTLRFTEGDTAVIHVYNRMNVETSIHWHGLLVPPGMDGVPNVSFPPIRPGSTFTYTFPIRQSGTYWYHSHTSLQEQSGVYGSIVIEPKEPVHLADRDYVILLSDWTNEDPHAVNRTLKRGSEWYAIEKGSAQSIFGAIKLGMLGAYLKRELQRMPPMDIADVAYDRFLANGKPESVLRADPGETIRLRLIDGSSTTYFLLDFAGGPMTIISADGLAVKPVEENRFLIAVAETYDVIIKVPKGGSYEFRATAQDGSGFASVWIGSGPPHPAPEIPKPNLYANPGKLSMKRVFALTPAGSMGMTDAMVKAGKFDKPGMAGMNGMGKMAGMKKMPAGKMQPGTTMAGEMAMEKPLSVKRPATGKKYGRNYHLLASDVSSSGKLALDGKDPARPWVPYKDLQSVIPTAFSGDKPLRVIRLTLDGDMERYVWFLNNKPLSESDSIRIKKGEIVRFIMVNRTMMHHPMHLHGHFFRVLNGKGEFSPLKHTVDVAPMSTTVIEFNANEFGDWFFHCHLLYHMKSGMARLVHYEGFTLNPQLSAVRPNLYKDSWYAWGRADLESNMAEGLFILSNTRNIVSLEWETGWHNVKGTEWEGVLAWDRYVNRFFSVFAGLDEFGGNRVREKTRGVLGFRYLLPLNLESRTWLDSEGGARFNLGKTFQLTPRFLLFYEAQYDSHDKWEGRCRISYIVRKNLSLVVQWHSDYGVGGGVRFRF